MRLLGTKGLNFSADPATFPFRFRDHRLVHTMRPFKLGLAALMGLLFCFGANAQPATSNAPDGEPPKRTAKLSDDASLRSDAPVAIVVPSTDEQPAPSSTPDTNGTSSSNPTPLHGTEYFVTSPKGQSAQEFAAIASKATGVPIYVVREIDDRHALFAIDQARITNQLEQRLRARGLVVQRIPSEFPSIMGRIPAPWILIKFSDLRTQPSTVFSLHKALAKIANADISKRNAAYMELAAQIRENTSVPTTVFAGQQAGSVILVPAGDVLGSDVSKKIAGFKGASAEPVRFVRPFHKVN